MLNIIATVKSTTPEDQQRIHRVEIKDIYRFVQVVAEGDGAKACVAFHQRLDPALPFAKTTDSECVSTDRARLYALATGGIETELELKCVSGRITVYARAK